MDIYFHNTLTGKKELFSPITPGHVRMYNCGPTVYDYVHIGNLRSYVFADILRRVLEWNEYEVTQVINITDVGHLVSDADEGEDKIEKGAKREGKTAREVADFYTQSFFTDLDKLNISREIISFPKATDYIAEQINMIKTLEEKGFTYIISDGVYFDTMKFPAYGKLGNINLSGLEEGARIGVNSEKRNSTDFALWKFSPKDTKREMEWESPWGIGFPGWHIECSAMSKALLGVTFDIHTGGIDHIPVHHNNEIAQSMCANNAPLARYWLHNAFLTVNEGDKMAKSGENFITLQTLIDRNIDPLAYRYLLLTARYSSPLQFSWEALEGARTAWKKMKSLATMSTIVAPESDVIVSNPDRIEYYKKTFTEYVNDDLDTPKAIALIWELSRDDEISTEEKSRMIVEFDVVLGLGLGNLDNVETAEIPEEIRKLVTARDAARIEKDFAKSDKLRAEIESRGFEVMDGLEGTKVQKK